MRGSVFWCKKLRSFAPPDVLKMEPKNPLFLGKWSNEKCIQIAFSDHFPSTVRDISVQKEIINRFLNFYLGGKVQKGLKAVDLIFAVISIMPLHEETEEFIWIDGYYKDNGTMFFLTPEDRLKADVGNINIAGKNNEKNKHNDKVANEEETRFEEMSKEATEEALNFNEKAFEILHEVNGDCGENDTNSDNGTRNNTDSETENDSMNSENTSENEEEDNKQRKQGKDEGVQKPTTSRNDQEKNPFKLPTNLQWYNRQPSKIKQPLDDTKLEYGPVQNSAFSSSCNKLLEEWDAYEKSRIILKYFFGIIALILMRATTKTDKHLKNTFESSKFLSKISFTQYYLKYSCPGKKCIKNSYRAFNKKDGKIPVMFAKIVLGSFRIDALRKRNGKLAYPKLNVFKLTVLSHTADFGFGLVAMIQKVIDVDQDHIFGYNINEVLEATYCKLTADSWKRLRFFFETYLVTTSKESTHHWARVISTDFFKYLSCNANYTLSVILAVFIEKMNKNPNIWESSWVKLGDLEDLKDAKEMGLRMFHEFKRRN